MEKHLEEQLERTKLLMTSLEIAKVSDNPVAQDLISGIKSSLCKAQSLIEKRRKLFNRKSEIMDEIEGLTKKCNLLASRAEEINQSVFPGQSFTAMPNENSEQQSKNCQNFNSFEVSPCPSEWANGALNTPMPMGHLFGQPILREEVEIPQIIALNPCEMDSVPRYMKGRLNCENINYFVSILNSVLKQKYSIVILKRKDVKRKDLIQYNNWKAQEKEYKMMGEFFFTEEDLANLASFKMDKQSEKITQILRHTKRLRQTRVTGKVQLYILIR